MSADNRSVHTDALATLGTVLPGDQLRDAVHIAVFAIQAKYPMSPGANVGIDPDGLAIWETRDKAVGIVDPFLERRVDTGEWFWLMVFPRQITSLNHVWAHPSFPDTGNELPSAPALVDMVAQAHKDAAETWLRVWISEADCPDFDTTIEECLAQQDHEYVRFSGLDAHGDIPPEFWHYLGVYTGEPIVSDPASFFSCSC